VVGIFASDMIMIGVDLLDDRNEALAFRGIDTFAGRVIVQIIRVANTGDAGYDPTVISVGPGARVLV